MQKKLENTVINVEVKTLRNLEKRIADSDTSAIVVIQLLLAGIKPIHF